MLYRRVSHWELNHQKKANGIVEIEITARIKCATTRAEEKSPVRPVSCDKATFHFNADEPREATPEFKQKQKR